MKARISESKASKAENVTSKANRNYKISKQKRGYLEPEPELLRDMKQGFRQHDNKYSSDSLVNELRSLPAPERRNYTMHLQRQYGNRKLQKLIVQARLKVGSPGDEFERGADLVANIISRVPGPGSIQKMAKPNLGDRQPSQGLDIFPQLKERIGPQGGSGRILNAAP